MFLSENEGSDNMLEKEFRMEVWRSLRSIRSYAEHIFESVTPGSGLTLLQAFTLAHINMKKISSIGEVAKELGINQSNASTMCKKLEREGFIKRVRSNDDERVVVLEMTEKGQETIQIMEEHFDRLEPIISQMPDDKFETVLSGLRATEEIFGIIVDEIEKQNI